MIKKTYANMMNLVGAFSRKENGAEIGYRFLISMVVVQPVIVSFNWELNKKGRGEMKLSELRKPETSIDWSKHELKITKNENVLIHDLKKPGSSTDRVVFINSMGVCSVTGDYGNWIFCREFHPSEEGWVSRSYWSEKLKIASTQHSGEFDQSFAIEQIDEYLKDYGEDMCEEEKEWWNILKEKENQIEYDAHAYDYPESVEPECIPRGLKRKYWLSAVYDAFNEMCNRIQKEKELQTSLI